MAYMLEKPREQRNHQRSDRRNIMVYLNFLRNRQREIDGGF